MANGAGKTEHAGAKHGDGAYWGPKADAKAESNTLRRVRDRSWMHDLYEEAQDADTMLPVYLPWLESEEVVEQARDGNED